LGNKQTNKQKKKLRFESQGEESFSIFSFFLVITLNNEHVSAAEKSGTLLLGLAKSIYRYTLAAIEEELKPFEDAIKILDDYFVPKAAVPFERHVFRQKEQQNGEKIDQFVCRLRQNAITCEFKDVDKTIRDQLTEKCQDQKLRRKFLEKRTAILIDL